MSVERLDIPKIKIKRVDISIDLEGKDTADKGKSLTSIKMAKFLALSVKTFPLMIMTFYLIRLCVRHLVKASNTSLLNPERVVEIWTLLLMQKQH